MIKYRSLPVLAYFFVLFSPSLLFSQLIGPTVNPADFDLDVTADEQRIDILQKKYFTLDNWDGDARLFLSLFPDATFTAEVRDIEEKNGLRTWNGHLPDVRDSYVILSQKEGIYFGKILGPDFRSFQILHKGQGVYGVYEIDANRLPHLDNDQAQDEFTLLEDNIAADQTICETDFSCPATTIDVLVVYTPAARAELGGTAATEAAIQAAITEMNTVNSNSKVIHTFNLSHTEEINFVESGSSRNDLRSLRSTSDGIMDGVHQLRYIHRADLVALVSSSDYCGIGYVPTSNTFFDESSGFSISGVNCMTGNLTMAHEIGHNMGLSHDRYVSDPGSPPACNNHFGYVNQAANGGSNSQRWRTVMAYNDQCSDEWGFNCRRRPYWSNPEIFFGTDPMGIANGASDAANSAFALNRSACLVAAMSDQLVSLPVLYHAWDAQANRESIELSWATSEELNNQGFDIEIRGEHQEEFVSAGFVKGQGTSSGLRFYTYNIRNVYPGKHYVRLKQIDIDGTSEYSSVKEVEIGLRNQVYHRVYPNPGKEKATLEFVAYRSSEYSIDLMDINGSLSRSVYTGELEKGAHSFELSLEGLTPGLYFYSIRSSIDQEMGKMWVE